jgi:hypothetical protein
MKILNSILLLILIIGLSTICLYAQMKGLHGDFAETRDGLHAGNLFRTTFYNDGTFGKIQDPPDIAGEWPINSGRIYMIDGNVFVGSEVIDTQGDLKHIISEVRSCVITYSTGDRSPDGEWWTFLPLGGFANPKEKKIAMSKWPWAWPPHWPDIADPGNPIYSPDGWAGSWNGYFGRDVFNADEESYFVADDYQNKEFSFYPDSIDSLRRGLGIRMYVRGFQWSNALVEDALFVLFDLENIGTHKHDKMVFGYKFGNNMGDTMTGGDGGDDNGAYNKDEDVAYLFDYDDIGYGGWSPVGYFGGAFLESPGNHYDGIDNDGDGKNGSGKIITEELFAPNELTVGEKIVLIDYTTFERTVMDMPGDTILVHYQDLVFKFWPGKVVEEVPFNLVDDNLNGIIDENNGVTFGDPPVTTYLYVGQDMAIKYVDYTTGEGSDNILIDEKRDDGIDNDSDWDAQFDDLGADGAAFTGDAGEGDGKPTTGEPHYDKTDIDETDMLGLTSFTLYKWETIPHYEDEKVWENIVPGFFDDIMQRDNIELLYGSGYFPMKPGQIERFSMGIMCGINLLDFLENKKWVAKAYNENYNFTRAPLIPTVKAVAGNNRVTLYWDDIAETSVDPISGEDFEGYCIYRSTDPGWNDMPALTDYNAVPSSIRKPLAQFDIKDNGFDGPATVDIRGIHFNLGDNTGIVHSYVDTTAKNGYTYYYAVTAYDHGDPGTRIPPTECAKFISISTSGEIDKGPNVVIVRPEAPSAGFIPANFDSSKIKRGANTTTSCILAYELIEPALIKDNHTYRITFEDTLIGSPKLPATKNFTLLDQTTNSVLFDKSTLFHNDDELPLIDGFRLKFYNNPDVLELDEENSTWSREDVYPFQFRSYTALLTRPDELISADFEIIVGDVGIDTSIAFTAGTLALPAIPVNFTIMNTSLNKKVKVAFRDRDVLADENGMLTYRSAGPRSDEIYFLTDSLVASWKFNFIAGTGTLTQPKVGDVLTIKLNKPLLSHDVFEFTTHAEKVDNELAKTEIDNIKVVPNPYVVANSWEPFNPYANGRGPRELHFIHLPPKCTIKIFNMSGQLVAELQHDEPAANGTEIWDMMTKDNLEIAYGVYIYHVEAQDIGQKIGKFAVIK